MQTSQDTPSATPQGEPDGYSKINTAMLLAFINRLLGATRGIDNELNTAVSKLKATLERSVSDDELLNQIKQVERQIMLQPNVLTDTLKIGDSATTQAAKSLANLLQNDPKLSSELQLVLAEPKATAITALQMKVQSLFCIYHSAIKNLQSSNGSNDNFSAVTHKKICDDLQRLINELDFAGGFGSNLKKIRQRLLQGVEDHELVDICLQIINNVIEGAREERLASKTFLHAIVEELNNIAYKFDSSLVDNNNINKKQISLLANLKERIDILDLDVSTCDNLAETKLHVQQGLEIISSSIQQQEQLLQEKILLELQIKAVQAQLEELKKETLLHTQRLEAQQHKLYLDSLTQVYNRTALDERFKLEFKRWQRYQTNTTVAMIDIDHFKNINDSFGHIAGDKALKIVARALQKSIKDKDFIARFGGEEFVVLLADLEPHEIPAILDQLRNTIKNIPFRFKGEQVSISISIGATQFSADDNDAVEPFERADKALYEAKSSGRDKVIIRI
ncbi:GGDEF domain-containing protein [Moritella dasanensis]|uniref:GGDEF domain-containing protein n=1 Tax=Moritella dasanensis TaxID=428031 RepID=UPI0002F5D5B3|nr:GGDEF domain-containing protein [Moritella dasanensis]